MKAGRRALGIAESYRGTADGATSSIAGAVVRADRTVDDFVFGHCTVGGTDATDAIIRAFEELDRQDVQFVFVTGVAPAWYNIIDLETLSAAIDRPVISVSFEASEGLETGIEAAFEGESRTERLETYRALPDRKRIDVGANPLFVRSIGLDEKETASIIDAYTHERRPEPLRVAKRLASRIDAAKRTGIFKRE